jgi:hypothetical protein
MLWVRSSSSGLSAKKVESGSLSALGTKLPVTMRLERAAVG